MQAGGSSAGDAARAPRHVRVAGCRRLLHLYFKAGSRLLTVSQVAEQLGVCAATVYKLCATGALQYVRVLNSIRIADEWIQEFTARRPADS